VRGAAVAVNSYKGESDGKRIARAMLYRSIFKYLSSYTKIAYDDAIILSGPEAIEVPIIFRWLLWQGSVIAVDLDSSAKEKIYEYQKLYKTVYFKETDVNYYFSWYADSGRTLSFVHLDFCGPLLENQVAAIRKAEKLICPGGVLAVTWLGARENKNSYISLLNREIGSRLSHVLGAVKKIKNWDTLHYDQYNSGKSPMACCVLVKTHNYPPFVQRVRKIIQLDKFVAQKQVLKHKYILRKAIENTIAAGITTEDISILYNTPVGTVRAWKAHQTMSRAKSSA
jgi:hypothetical protein